MILSGRRINDDISIKMLDGMFNTDAVSKVLVDVKGVPAKKEF